MCFYLWPFSRNYPYAKERKFAFARYVSTKVIYLTIIPRARMGSKSIAHEPEGRMGY